MAITDYYVDPSIAGNSGSGTIGDPYGDLQYALDSITRNTTDGDRINIKSGTAEVLTGSLSFATYGTPNIGAGLILQGYTSSQGDGGVGEIDANGNDISSANYVSYVDLKMHNGSASGWLVKSHSAVIVNCEIYDVYNGINASIYSTIENCNIYNCDNYGIHMTDKGGVNGCYVRSRASDSRGAMSRCIYNVHRPGQVTNCIISCDSTTIGAEMAQDGAVIYGCSILSDGGTGEGIRLNTAAVGSGAWNNLIEGFSGTGGDGIFWATASPGESKGIVAYNTIFNCASSLTNDNNIAGYKTNNTTAGGSLFKKSGADTFANRFAYFEPNTSNAGINLNGNGSRGAVAAAGGTTTSPKHPLARF